MYSGEPTVNTALAEVLQDMRHDWNVGGEKQGRILKTGKKPDIYITERGSMPVIIETEWMPAHTLKDDVETKLGVENIDGQKIEAVIGIRLPERLKQYEHKELRTRLRVANDLEYAAYTPERFPKDGWLTGDLTYIAATAQIIAVSRTKVEDSVSAMLDSINSISKLVNECGPDIKRKIAEILNQKQNTQTWRMAGLILSNALVFHTHIAGHRGIKTIMDISVVGQIPPLSLLGVWDKILGINYYAIFKVARNILSSLDTNTAHEVVEHLVNMSNRINRTGLRHSTDMYGELIQKMIEDRKTLASFYTRPESASLLAGLVTPQPDSPLYNSGESISSVRIMDPACGTGTLLTSLYRNLIRNYEINGGNMKNIHAKMVGECIHGFDVLPSAVHLTASALADVFPSMIFEESKVATTFLGMHGGALHLGSLDLILETPTFDQKGMLITSGGEKPYHSHELHGMLFDMVIMNPPFTSNTREGGREGHAIFSSFGIDAKMQKEMSKREKKIFHETCADGNAGEASNFMAIADRKLKPGGTLGLVLPATLVSGSSWIKTREMLKLKYEDLIVVSI
ncbi:MAG: SAM-dependent DNA methyltransferase [Cenarchaeum sp. SB0661_bin_35]|nr:SAM-dependent DNA methyltransferase [Cenarchaeum sp. SB0667_bin_13]MXZ94021.1 SAM-dependent DNA methyltransferase [Cenarchaeum sp. SB0666_bin_15]MYC79077.1 SAM-dependent DNA methyltransferase [Cenarchaeum sp. SB0661_bin_35]MYD58017.1 SAM-dependent DNA methyltransferase [Cenarchaeum sp. SB0678_bin_8]MYI51830.1 SAM-dependent DNA methyltransferase [Cenarchaeum sp. SB0673_bin_9]MYJ27993.1 SAM-dependent DNA methyltransferase [Cenarchaeum sp. SB0672_bin_9]